MEHSIEFNNFNNSECLCNIKMNKRSFKKMNKYEEIMKDK